jgi:cytochrome c-type biogenesis protein CcmI
MEHAMTLFVLSCTLMVAAASAWLVRPLLRSSAPSADAERDRFGVYRSQLREIYADARLGLLDAVRLEEAEREIEQRVLEEANRPDPPRVHGMTGSTKVLVPVILVALPLAATALYWLLGTPDVLRGERAGSVVADPEPHSRTADSLEVLTERLARRLEREPGDGDGWALLARSYSVLGREAEAVAAYRNAVKLLPEDLQLKAELAQARSAAPVVQAAAHVSGRVTLSPALAQRAAPDDTVFVFARAPQGPRAPVALLTAKVRELPMDFVLDDGKAMTPDLRLSSFERVLLIARVSKSGDARPAPGDLEGSVGPVQVGAKGVRLRIDRTMQ